MLQFLKMRRVLIGLAFLTLGACADSADDMAAAAADPGNRPYPNLGAYPTVPTRPSAAKRVEEEKRLIAQRDAAKAFDAQLRAIDPVLDPASRPPEPASLAGAAPAAPQPAPARPAAATPTVAPLAVLAPVPAPAAPALNVPQPMPPSSIAAARPGPGVVRTAPPSMAVAPAPIPAGAPARNSWIVGDILFADGSAILSAESRRTLRDAVVAAQDRGGRVRITPSAGPALSPPEQALSPRRAAAAGGELEALGLDRARILIDPGALRAARVAVEF